MSDVQYKCRTLSPSAWGVLIKVCHEVTYGDTFMDDIKRDYPQSTQELIREGLLSEYPSPRGEVVNITARGEKHWQEYLAGAVNVDLPEEFRGIV